jgi:nicotinamidase-related amidase
MNNVALIIVDFQNGFDEVDYWGGNRNNPKAEENTRRLLDVWRERKLPLFHIKHDSINIKSKLAPGQWGNEIKEIVKPLPGEVVISKTVNSAFIGTDLKLRLDSQKIKSVVVVGLQTDHCVSTTARMAGNFGYNTIVVSDATATFDRVGIDGIKSPSSVIHTVHLSSLDGEFATVLTTEELLQKIQIEMYA